MHFPALDSLLAQLRDLAQSHPDQVELFTYGRSRAGEPLHALRLGTGPLRVLVYAFPQPDEPLGGAVIAALLRALLRGEALRRPASWLLLPCVDPDGARRNEGWFTAPPDLAAYARRHFRPPEGEQVEWSFPSADPAWPWETPLPETRALQGLIDDFGPQLLLPLHNALLGGAYAFLSAEAAALAPALPAIWNGHGLPTHRGEPDLPFAEALAPGIYRLPELHEIAAALSAQGVADPAGLLRCGAPAYLHARGRGSVWTVVPELPLFTVPGIDDDHPTALDNRRLLRQTLAADRVALNDWTALYEQVAPLLDPANPYLSALASHRRCASPLLTAAQTCLATDPTPARPATAAEVADAQRVSPYLRLLPLGLLAQALAVEGERLPPAGRRLHMRVGADLERALAALLPALGAVPIAATTLVQATLDMLLLAIKCSLE